MDRLDGVTRCPHLVDERHDQRFRGSSSPAKKIAADLSTSLTSRRRRFSARNRRISSRSAVLTPTARPISCWETHRRTDSGETPNDSATCTRTAVAEEYSLRCSVTRRTARLRSSWVNLAWHRSHPLNHSQRSGREVRTVYLSRVLHRCRSRTLRWPLSVQQSRQPSRTFVSSSRSHVAGDREPAEQVRVDHQQRAAAQSRARRNLSTVPSAPDGSPRSAYGPPGMHLP